mmetsp:Transcript_57502/g.166999  ORF Transcript_57502/g.166999 Transcript_57502/m.166999 type:complete len:272 (+) Transcript_57502:172-987(+)
MDDDKIRLCPRKDDLLYDISNAVRMVNVQTVGEYDAVSETDSVIAVILSEASKSSLSSGTAPSRDFGRSDVGGSFGEETLQDLFSRASVGEGSEGDIISADSGALSVMIGDRIEVREQVSSRQDLGAPRERHEPSRSLSGQTWSSRFLDSMERDALFDLGTNQEVSCGSLISIFSQDTSAEPHAILAAERTAVVGDFSLSQAYWIARNWWLNCCSTRGQVTLDAPGDAHMENLGAASGSHPEDELAVDLPCSLPRHVASQVAAAEGGADLR